VIALLFFIYCVLWSCCWLAPVVELPASGKFSLFLWSFWPHAAVLRRRPFAISNSLLWFAGLFAGMLLTALMPDFYAEQIRLTLMFLIAILSFGAGLGLSLGFRSTVLALNSSREVAPEGIVLRGHDEVLLFGSETAINKFTARQEVINHLRSTAIPGLVILSSAVYLRTEAMPELRRVPWFTELNQVVFDRLEKNRRDLHALTEKLLHAENQCAAYQAQLDDALGTVKKLKAEREEIAQKLHNVRTAAKGPMRQQKQGHLTQTFDLEPS